MRILAQQGWSWPVAYIKVIAVKKLVVGFRSGQVGPPRGEYWPAALPLGVYSSLPEFVSEFRTFLSDPHYSWEMNAL